MVENKYLAKEQWQLRLELKCFTEMQIKFLPRLVIFKKKNNVYC